MFDFVNLCCVSTQLTVPQALPLEMSAKRRSFSSSVPSGPIGGEPRFRYRALVSDEFLAAAYPTLDITSSPSLRSQSQKKVAAPVAGSKPPKK